MKITFKDIPPRFLKAKVAEVKEKKGNYGTYLQIIFRVQEESLKYYKFTALIKPNPLKISKFYRWVNNILGYEPDDNFSTEDLIGKECFIFLTKKNKYYTVLDVSSYIEKMDNNNPDFL